MLRTYLKNYEKIKAKAKLLPFDEARRRRIPLYEALIKELYEAGCSTAAVHFRCLVEKESKLMAIRSIGVRVSKNKRLLMNIFTKVKLAEAVKKQTGCENTYSVSLQYLYEVLEILHKHIIYDWLLKEIFRIVSKICEKKLLMDDHCNEIIARIFFKYGLYLSKSNENELSHSYLQSAIKLARSDMWLADPLHGEWETLHQIIGVNFANILIEHSDHLVVINFNEAKSLAEWALLIIAEIGIGKNKKIHYKATLKLVKYLVQENKYNEALTVLKDLDSIELSEIDDESLQLYCRNCLYKGICYSILKKPTDADMELSAALKLSSKHNWKHEKADVLLNLGKLYSQKSFHNHLAYDSFEKAKALYKELGDIGNYEKTSYLLANIKAEDISPYLVATIKDTEVSSCNLYNLRQWKNKCQPFWKNMVEGFVKETQNKNYCMLDKDT